MKSIFDIFDTLPPKINIIDIGALNVGNEIYHPLVKKNLCTVIGFEPIEEECRKLNQLYNGRHRFLPYAIGNGEEQSFHITASPMCSSLFEPDLELSEKFSNYAHLRRVIEVKKIKTHRLDDVSEIDSSIDYLKLDVQGAEFQIFQNAEKILKQCVIIHTEAMLIPLYKNQPLLSDIDEVLRKHGFLHHKFLGFGGRPFKPFFKNESYPRASIGQQMWTDVVYVKNFMHFDQLQPAKLISLGIVLHEVYRSVGLCHLALQAYDRKTGSSIAKKYYSNIR